MRRHLYVALVVLIFHAYVCDANNLQHDVGIRQDDHNDVIFSDRLLWTVTSSGKAGCAVSCMKDHRCLSFTVSGRNNNTRKTQCRGYDSTGENMASSGTPSPGARFYLLLGRAYRPQTTTQPPTTSLALSTEESMTSLATTEDPMTSLTLTTEESMTFELSAPTTKRQRRREEPPTPTTPPPAAQRPANVWMQIPGSPAQCTGNLECAKGPYMECFERECLCTPGYFYSLSQQGCVIDCQEENFQRLVMEYPLWYIEDNNYYSLVTPTLRECMELCFADPSCRSLEYRFTSGQCSHSMYTPLDVHDMWKKSSPDDPLYYYQKLCA